MMNAHREFNSFVISMRVQLNDRWMIDWVLNSWVQLIENSTRSNDSFSSGKHRRVQFIERWTHQNDKRSRDQLNRWIQQLSSTVENWMMRWLKNNLESSSLERYAHQNYKLDVLNSRRWTSLSWTTQRWTSQSWLTTHREFNIAELNSRELNIVESWSSRVDHWELEQLSWTTHEINDRWSHSMS